MGANYGVYCGYKNSLCYIINYFETINSAINMQKTFSNSKMGFYDKW